MSYCKNCGKQVDPNAAVCLVCGFAPDAGQSFCSNCGTATLPGAAICTNCGFALQAEANVPAEGGEQKSKMTAGLLGIFLGVFGVHNFYLGRMTNATIQIGLGIGGIVLTFCVGLGILLLIGSWIWGLVEGIMILTGSIKTDGKGNPLI